MLQIVRPQRGNVSPLLARWPQRYERARWYDPVVGKWISEDPIAFAGGDSNLSRYVGGHPTFATDPMGLSENVEFKVVDKGTMAELDKGLPSKPYDAGMRAWFSEYNLNPADADKLLAGPLQHPGGRAGHVSRLFFVSAKVKCDDKKQIEVEVWESRKVEIYDITKSQWTTAPDEALKGGQQLSPENLQTLKQGGQIVVAKAPEFSEKLSLTELEKDKNTGKNNYLVLLTDLPTLPYAYPDKMTRMTVKQSMVVKIDGKEEGRQEQTFEMGWDVTPTNNPRSPNATKYFKFK